MTTIDLRLTGTVCVWCRTENLDGNGNACPNDPTVCADCCPCHGLGLVGVHYEPRVSTVAYAGMTAPLAMVREWIGDVPLTPHRVAVVLRMLFRLTASDDTTLAVYDALRAEAL